MDQAFVRLDCLRMALNLTTDGDYAIDLAARFLAYVEEGRRPHVNAVQAEINAMMMERVNKAEPAE